MSVRLVIDGIDELRRALRNAPAEVAREGGVYTMRRGTEAANEIRTIYGRHRRTGRMQDGVVVTPLATNRFGAGVLVTSKSKEASIIENGTQIRRTGSGANRGAAPPVHGFIPPMVRARRALNNDLADILRRLGLEVINVD